MSYQHEVTLALQHIAEAVDVIAEHLTHPQRMVTGTSVPDGDSPERWHLFRRPNNLGLVRACLTQREWEDFEQQGSQLLLTYAQPMDYVEALALHEEIAQFYRDMMKTPEESMREDGAGPHTVTFFQRNPYHPHQQFSFMPITVTQHAVVTVGDVTELWEEHRSSETLVLVAAHWNSPDGVRVWIPGENVYKDAQALRVWRTYYRMEVVGVEPLRYVAPKTAVSASEAPEADTL